MVQNCGTLGYDCGQCFHFTYTHNICVAHQMEMFYVLYKRIEWNALRNYIYSLNLYTKNQVKKTLNTRHDRPKCLLVNVRHLIQYLHQGHVWHVQLVIPPNLTFLAQFGQCSSLQLADAILSLHRLDMECVRNVTVNGLNVSSLEGKIKICKLRLHYEKQDGN